MSTATLQARLKELSATLSQISPLIDQLRNFTTSVNQSDQVRVDLGAEIHAGLKDAEGELELLRVEVEALGTGSDSRRKASVASGDKEAEKERVVVMAGRLGEDLKRIRGDYRNAQLQAKKNAELAKRKERELLLSRSQTFAERQKQPSEKLTQDDLELNASNDVTAALRRTHHLMQAELSRSQFAQETLEQSTAAISSLSESYTSLDTLLSSSRSLANSLLRSQKSDTWYLETAFYILLGTITWLLFRRVLYGPVWWLIWLPLKLVMRVVFAMLGVVGLSNTAVQSSPSPMASDISATLQEAASAVTGTAVPNADTSRDQPQAQEEEDRLIDKIGKMAEEENNEKPAIDDISPEEKARQDEMPRNTKKRMFEADKHAHDEL